MAQVNSTESFSAGLARPSARYALLVTWLGIAVADDTIQQRIALSGWAAVLAYTLPAVAIVALTTRGSSLRPVAASVVIAGTVLPVVLLLVGGAPAMEYGLVNVAMYILVMLIPRGHPWLGGSVALAALTVLITWGLMTHQPPAGLRAMATMPGVALVVAYLWWLLIVVTSRRERRAIGATEVAELQRTASLLAEREYFRRMADLAEQVRPLLVKIASGEPLDEALHRQLRAVEGDVRDQLRAPGLRHPALSEAIAEARERGAEILLLSGPDVPETLDQRVADTLIAVVSDPTVRAATIRAQPPTRGSAFTVVVTRDAGVDRLELRDNGVAVDRDA